MKKNDFLSFIKRNKYFSYLWLSQALSQITLNMINFVMATRIYEKTGSTLAVSFIWIFYYLPAFFFGPFSGYFVDRWNRRKILMITNFLQGITVLLYFFVGGKVYPIYPIVFLYSFLNQFYCPAESASLPWLVNKKDLAIANGLFMLTSQSALILGFGISGLLMRIFGQNNPIFISSFGLFIASLSVFFLPKNEPQNKFKAKSLSGFWHQIIAGYSIIKNNRLIFYPILFLTGIQIFAVMLGITLPSISSDILGIQLQDAGPLLVVPVGLGALTGASLISRWAGRVRKKMLIKRGMAFAVMVFILLSTALPRLGAYKTLFAIPLMFILGFAGFLVFIPNQTIVQEKTPSQFRGRVFGTIGFISMTVSLPCLLFAATVVDTLGVNLFLFLIGLLLLGILASFRKIESHVLGEAEVK